MRQNLNPMTSVHKGELRMIFISDSRQSFIILMQTCTSHPVSISAKCQITAPEKVSDKQGKSMMHEGSLQKEIIITVRKKKLT